jgi:hypothetical protein
VLFSNIQMVLQGKIVNVKDLSKTLTLFLYAVPISNNRGSKQGGDGGLILTHKEYKFKVNHKKMTETCPFSELP